jgi:hypothetical protein
MRLATTDDDFEWRRKLKYVMRVGSSTARPGPAVDNETELQFFLEMTLYHLRPSYKIIDTRALKLINNSWQLTTRSTLALLPIKSDSGI